MTVGKTVDTKWYATILILIQVKNLQSVSFGEILVNETKYGNNIICNTNSICCNDTCYYDAIGGYNMSKAEETAEDKKIIEEWLAKGNKITICPPEATTPEEDVVYIYKVGKRGKK